ncbi:MAG: GIY-YIG nuclease family protein [Crocinitomicaceae bacterium]|nr:GIY-YIG nuclease family protein [Crocinitomicaceae bacterium]
MNHNYFVYILSNTGRTTLYFGVTKNIPNRILEHRENKKGFVYRYHCYELVYFEHFVQIEQAISREKQLKGWNRSKKESLIRIKNPNWLNLLPELY